MLENLASYTMTITREPSHAITREPSHAIVR